MDREQKFKYMTEEPIPRLVCSLAVADDHQYADHIILQYGGYIFCWTD